MKRIISLLLSVTIALSLSSFVVRAEETEQNLLSNGGFEETLFGTDSWLYSNKGNWYNERNVTAERTDAQKYSGSYSAELNNASFGQRVTLTAGKTYRLTAYVKADEATTSPSIGFYDGTQSYPASTQYAVVTLPISATTEWKEVQLEFNCKATQDYLIGLFAWDDTINVYFDDVSLVEFEPVYDGTGIKNGYFSDDMDGWFEIGAESAAMVNDGVLRITSPSNGTKVYQTVTGLENGIYDLSVSAKTSDIDGIAYVYAKTAGHTMASTSIPQTTADGTVLVPNIIVEDGNCEIGVYVKGDATVTVDNFVFSETADTRVPFLKGGEISKLTYVEDMGGKFYRTDGSEGDALQIMAESGFNLARIRLLDAPGKGHGEPDYYLPEGYMTEDDCLSLARRAKDKGMQILFSFAYSDYWVDGEKQYIPNRWQQEIKEQNLSGEGLYSYLETKTYEYTKDMMEKLIAQGTCPEYVSIGNEIQVGLYFGNQKLKDSSFISVLYNNADMLARFLNAGARAVRETSPETKIVLHSDNGGKLSQRNTFKSALTKVGNNFDVIGVSYYPYYNADVSIDTVVSEFKSLISTYNKDVIIMETGYNWAENRGDGYESQLKDSGYYQSIYGETQDGQRAFLTELYTKLKQVAGGRCIGDLYWDPIMIYDGGTYKIGWATKESDDWADGNVVSNSTIFDFKGKAVAGQLAMKYNTNSTDKINITGKVTNDGNPITDTKITFTVNGNQYNTTTDKFGEYIVSVPYPDSDKLMISAKGSSTQFNKETPVEGVLLSSVDFADFEEGTEADEFFVNGWLNPNGTLSYEVGGTTKKDNQVLYTALYDNSGTLVAVSSGQSGEIEISEEGIYTLKSFLWKNVQEPFLVSEEKQIEYN